MNNFLQLYRQHKDFPKRYILPQNLFRFLERFNILPKKIIGYSSENKPIYQLTWGKGKISVLAWSQMHGNESNSTLAFLDFLFIWEENPLYFEELFETITLDFIVMLNPDGAQKWTRQNAEGIDLNRDFQHETSVELPILKKISHQKKYHYALNLHEQRTIFSTNGTAPATLSFLSPSESEQREITPNRRKAMAVIASMATTLQQYIPHQLARYTDEFYPHSTGDNFMKAGIPTILFEGGHFQNDYHRKETRRFYTFALYECLRAIAEIKGGEQGWEYYFDLPENQESHYDIIYRNVTLETDFPCTLDIGVQYKEVLNTAGDDIEFIPIVVAVGDCSQKKGWKEEDCTGKKIISPTKFPKLDAEVNFTFE